MGWEFPWYSSYGSDFNYDFHTTVDDQVAPVLIHFRTEAEPPRPGRPGPADMPRHGAAGDQCVPARR